MATREKRLAQFDGLGERGIDRVTGALTSYFEHVGVRSHYNARLVAAGASFRPDFSPQRRSAAAHAQPDKENTMTATITRARWSAARGWRSRSRGNRSATLCRMLESARASMVLPAPGAPRISTLCPPAAAGARDRPRRGSAYSGRWQTASTLLPSGSRTNAP